MDHKKPKTPPISEKEGVEAADASIMHTLNGKPMTATTVPGHPMKIIMPLIVVAVLGIGTGFLLSKISSVTGKQIIPIGSIDPTINKGKTFGSDDLETFKDAVEGKLEEGGIEGEGQFHLVRPGGESQNVYLTSSLVDLSQFVGRKIKVWGQTQKAQTAGWLMDVGRVEVQ